MELHKNNGPVEISGGGRASNFSIAMNAKAFRVLSDTLYQDKIGSLVREISCNALDGHTMAGHPERPILIHLPDSFEPWFTVRDYGVGLSPESVETVFCVYFESTKDQSNDAIGAFGLGAKTPFAYTDQFNVTSIHGGRKYIYNAFINSEGIPQVMLMMEVDAEGEENGVEVKIGVKPEDFREFRVAVKEQLRFFRTNPIVENGPPHFTAGYNYDASHYIYESDNISLVDFNSVYNSELNVVQGPVGYRLDYAMMTKFLDSEQTAFLQTLRQCGANLYFNIGEIGVTASREGVEYNPHTVENIKNKLDAVRAEIESWIMTQLTGLPTDYERVLFFNKSSAFRTLMSGINLNFGNAKRNSDGTYRFTLKDVPEFMAEVEHDQRDAAGNLTKVKKSERVVFFTEYFKTGADRFTTSRQDSDSVAITPNEGVKYVIVLRDAGAGRAPVARMKHHFTTTGADRLISIALRYDDIIAMDGKLIQAITDHMGGFAEIALLSDLPDAPRAPSANRARSDYSRPSAYELGRGSDFDTVANWTRLYDKFTEDYLVDSDGNEVTQAAYVVVERQRITSSTNAGLYCRLLGAKIDGLLPVFAVREADLPKLEASPTEWVPLAEHVQEIYDSVVSSPGLRRHALIAECLSAMDRGLSERLESLYPELLPEGRLARVAALRARLTEKHAEGTQKFTLGLVNLAGFSFYENSIVKTFRRIGDTATVNLPMLKTFLNSRYGAFSDEEKAHVVAYINAFDKA